MTNQKKTTTTILMELSRIVISEINNQQVIFLREVEGGRREFPIVIGIFEATSIDRRVKGSTSPRPLTHDLLCSAVELLGGTFQDVYIHQMQEQTFFSSLRIKQKRKLLEIDARPSDAIAIAIAQSPPLPILVEEEILERAIAQHRAE